MSPAAAQKVWDALEAHAQTMKGTRVDIKWGSDRCHLVSDKMFAVFPLDAAGRPKGVGFKVEDARFLELTGVPGIRPAPYLARAHWISVERHDALLLSELKVLVERAHQLIAAKLTKKRQRELGLLA